MRARVIRKMWAAVNLNLVGDRRRRAIRAETNQQSAQPPDSSERLRLSSVCADIPPGDGLIELAAEFIAGHPNLYLTLGSRKAAD